MFNKAILIGRLVVDPELRQTPGGVSVCTFRIAVDRSFTSKDGERQADFLDIVAWRERAEFVTRYFSKGKLILVEGSVQSRTYTDKNDQKRSAVEVVAENIRFVGPKEGGGGGGGGYRPLPDDSDVPSTRMGGNVPAPAYSSGSAESFAEIEDDGDLPF
ncbi:MAG: single-stranded DNA-binding protein [Oscillospiraceae bacterium]|jgi:single-strand DNA-binding protein|nr:single-stranded DNA-binding protein [Oscillospiraceae bacterium]